MRMPRAAALLLLLTALPALAAGRAFRVRTYANARSADSVGEREPGLGAFWVAQSDYDNPTGGQIPRVLRLATDGTTSTWLIDPVPQGYAPIALRRNAVTGLVWVLVPLFSEGKSALYTLNPTTNAVTRAVLPFAGLSLQLDPSSGTPWVTGTGKIAKLAGTALTVWDVQNFAGFSSRIDAQRRLWLEADNRTFRSFDVENGELDSYSDALNGMRALEIDGAGRVWAISEDQAKLLCFETATRVKTSFPLAFTAANWAGVGAGAGGLVPICSAYGPHVLIHAPGEMPDGVAVTLAAPEDSRLTGASSSVAVTSGTAARTDGTTPYSDRILYAESDRGRHLFSCDGIGLSSLLWSDGSETLTGSGPLQWWKPVTGAFTTRATLPAVVEIRPNDPANNFLTELIITNVDADPQVTLTFQTADAAYPVTLNLTAGTTRVLSNAVDGLRQLGAPQIPSGAYGPLTATFSNGRGVMTARVYTIFGSGAQFPQGSTTGFGFTSVDPAKVLSVYRTTLNGLKNTADFRTNVSVANVCGAIGPCAPLSVTASFFDDLTGRNLGEKTLDVPPDKLGQLDGPLAGFGGVTGETFSVQIQPYSAGNSGYDAYATVISASAQDAAFIRASSVAYSSTPTLPVVTDVIGSGPAHFVSECSITSTSAVTAVADVTFTSATSGNTVSEVLTLEPGHGVRYPNVIQHFREIAPAQIGVQDYGPVRIAFRNYAGGFASSRNTSDNGTGMAFTAVDPFIARAVRTKRIIGLKQTGDYRTNLAVVNLGPTTGDAAATITVQVSVKDSSGNPLGTPQTRTLVPGQLYQWARILTDNYHVTGEGYVATIERTAGQDPFEAYATVINNVTTDSTFLRAE